MLLNIPPLLHAIVRYYYCYSLLLLIIDIGEGERKFPTNTYLLAHSLDSEGKGIEGYGNLSSRLSDSQMPAWLPMVTKTFPVFPNTICHRICAFERYGPVTPQTANDGTIFSLTSATRDAFRFVSMLTFTFALRRTTYVVFCVSSAYRQNLQNAFQNPNDTVSLSIQPFIVIALFLLNSTWRSNSHRNCGLSWVQETGATNSYCCRTGAITPYICVDHCSA